MLHFHVWRPGSLVPLRFPGASHPRHNPHSGSPSVKSPEFQSVDHAISRLKSSVFNFLENQLFPHTDVFIQDGNPGGSHP